MQIVSFISAALAVATTAVAASAPSTAGIEALVQRRLPDHVGDFEFSIVNATTTLEEDDVYTVSSCGCGKIKVEGNSLSALATGCVAYTVAIC